MTGRGLSPLTQEQGRSKSSPACASCLSPSAHPSCTLPSRASPPAATQAAQGVPRPRRVSLRLDTPLVQTFIGPRASAPCLPPALLCTALPVHQGRQKPLQGVLGVRGEVRETRLAQQPALVGRPSGHVAWACPRRTTAIALNRRTPGHMLTVLSASCVTLGSHAPPLP